MTQSKCGKDRAITYFDVIPIRVSQKYLVNYISLISRRHRYIDLEINWRNHFSKLLRYSVDIF